jgi:hypothetical protein
MVDVVRCLVERSYPLERFVGIVPALIFTVDEHLDLDLVRMDADDAALKAFARDADVVAEFQLCPRDVVPCHTL